MIDRKLIKFYRSYYEVANELPIKHRGEFVMAILDYQFEGKEPKFTGILKLAWISQKHSLDKQIEGFKHATKPGPEQGPNEEPVKGPHQGTSKQEQEQEQGKRKKEEGQGGEDTLEIWPTFEDFWNAYDKKTDSKPKCKKKWEKLPHTLKEKIMGHLNDYIASTPNKKYRKNPLTYLNSEGWTHEIISDEKNKTNRFIDSDTVRKFAEEYGDPDCLPEEWRTGST